MSEIILPGVLRSAPTGSNYICDPPVTTTDIDYVVLVEKGQIDSLVPRLEEGGWKLDGSMIPGKPSEFRSLKKDNINYIVTDNPDFYESFCKATQIAKDLNLLDKKDRVKLFRIVMREFYK